LDIKNGPAATRKNRGEKQGGKKIEGGVILLLMATGKTGSMPGWVCLARPRGGWDREEETTKELLGGNCMIRDESKRKARRRKMLQNCLDF